MLTQKEIQARSTTLRDAIAVSIQHWQEIATASDAELEKASKFLVSEQSCGLCIYYKRIRRHQYCLLCPYDCGVASIWRKTSYAYIHHLWNKLRECAAIIVTDLEKLQ